MLPLLVCVCFAPFADAADSLDQRYLAGLRERRLFELAETYCLNRIGEPQLPAERRAELAIELAKTYAQHALHAPPAERAEIWADAHRVAVDFKRAVPDSPRLLLVDLQDGLIWLDQGEFARQEMELGADNPQQVEAAREYLRSAIGTLREVDKQIDVALRRAPQIVDNGGLTADQLRSLKRNITYELARAYRNQGQTYAKGSNDHLNSLLQALEQLEPIARQEPTREVAWKARLDRVICYRLLGDTAKASSELASLLETGPPSDILAHAQAEQLRLLLANDQLPAALAYLDQVAAKASPEFALARLETLIAAWKEANKANDEATAKQRQQQAAALVASIERDYGPYWMRRAESMLASVVTSGASSDVQTLTRAAESFYRSGQIDRAIATYNRIANEAFAAGDQDSAIEAAVTAAAIEVKEEQHAEAQARYLDIAAKLPVHPKAAEAHLAGIFQAAHRARRTSGDEQRQVIAEYSSLLTEHVEKWTQSPTADEARWWLSSLEQTEENWPRAIELLRNISSDHQRFEQAVRATAACYSGWLGSLKSAGKETATLAGNAANYFEELLIGPERRWPERWSPLHRFCAITAARLRLAHTAEYRRAEMILQAALAAANSDTPESWTTEAQLLLVHALVGQGRREQAVQAMERVAGGTVGGLLSLVEQLDRLSAAAGPGARKELAALQLRAIALLESRRDELAGDNLRMFEKARASALASAGQQTEAIAAFEQLIDKYPNDGNIHVELAELMSQSTDRDTLEAALRRWQQIQRRSRAGGERWFNARYQAVAVRYRLGERTDAAKQIRLTQALHPELGGAEMRRKFLRLLELCEQ